MGRPAEFERTEVVAKAMHLFWESGYNETSMTDLTKAMDMRPGSIYSTFGSKEDLLYETMNLYVDLAGQCCTQIVKESSSEREVIAEVFQFIIDEMAQQETRRGCLLVNVFLELSTVNDKIGQRARELLNETKMFLGSRLRLAQEKGEIDKSRSIDDLTTFLFGVFYALRVMGKAYAPKEEMEVMSKQALDFVFQA